MRRRDFMRWAAMGTGVCGAWAACGGELRAAPPDDAETISFGVVTDVHYAQIPPRDVRYYELSLKKLQQAVTTFQRRKLAFVIELGDFIDADPQKQKDLDYLQAARQVFEGFAGPRYYVLGNHCVYVLTKPQFLAGCGQERSWYSFNFGPYHGVVLDACFTKEEQPYQPAKFDWKDSWIPADQQRWLAEDLAKNKDRTTVVFVHQNLHDETRPCGIKNAPQVRQILEDAGNVLAVFQGHEHTGAYARIHGIHYCTLRGMIEGGELASNSYSVVTLAGGGRFRIEGYGKQPHLTLE